MKNESRRVLRTKVTLRLAGGYHMHTKTTLGYLPHQGDAAQDAAFVQPANCPLASCLAITSGKTELKRLKRTEAELREVLAREHVLLGQKYELMRQAELLGREANHRLLNGLQMVTSLLSMQSNETDDAGVAAQLKIAAGRIATIASVHRRLHDADCVESVELKQYLTDLSSDMAGMLPIECAVLVEGISLRVPNATGVPLGLIVSELVTNSAKHAKTKIAVRLDSNPGKGYALSISDDGQGLPEGFDPSKSKGLGMQIVMALVKQIDGQLLFDQGNTGRGACVTVQFFLPGLPPVAIPVLKLESGRDRPARGLTGA